MKLGSPKKDPNFKEPIANVTASVGREAILTCVVQDLAGYRVAWLRVDTQTILTISTHIITKNHRISVSHSDHRTWFLHIREVRESDRGWYMCQINTDPMKSQTGYLEVVVPPDILDYQTSTDMVVQEGSNVTLRCAATGSPEPTITWRREDGQLILLPSGDEVATIGGSSFNITKVNRLHMGSYLCIASNHVPPSVSKRIMLIVHFPPMISIPNQLVGAREGQELTLDCLSEAYPKSINYWTRDKDEIVPQGGKYEPISLESAYKVHMKLTINSVSPSDFGSYKCVSRNSLGDTDGSIKVYRITSNTNSSNSNTRYKGKLRHNSGNDIFEGNQDMLKERDLKLRGSKETNGDNVDDYEDSGVMTKDNPIILILVLVSFTIYLHHQPQLRTFFSV
ncbi:opioid-binding protein/cell adhesion molecule homolog isoform X3 [Lasioglossum baleicum]|uniref:opioid-binding protein/cell adhesion molecule homolog isoform X3 n=1 Tax=Lasioglossum baleicum TaxID=434251 RepID=UPI003FCEB397